MAIRGRGMANAVYSSKKKRGEEGMVSILV